MEKKNSKNKKKDVKKFIDFNKDKYSFYDNYYLNGINIVVKIPLIKNKESEPEMEIEKFSLVNGVYLTSY